MSFALEQLERCKAKKAITGKGATTSSSQPPVSPVESLLPSGVMIKSEEDSEPLASDILEPPAKKALLHFLRRRKTNHAQAPSVLPTQGSTPPPSTDKSNTPNTSSPQQSSNTQAQSAPPVQESIPTSSTDRSIEKGSVGGNDP